MESSFPDIRAQKSPLTNQAKHRPSNQMLNLQHRFSKQSNNTLTTDRLVTDGTRAQAYTAGTKSLKPTYKSIDIDVNRAKLTLKNHRSNLKQRTNDLDAEMSYDDNFMMSKKYADLRIKLGAKR
jgi:hypothetical protein